MRRNRYNSVRKFEVLEDRRMMAGISFANGVITVDGSDYHDAVEVRFDDDKVNIDLNLGESDGDGFDDGGNIERNISEVSRIIFNGLAGNDILTVEVDDLDDGVTLDNVVLEFRGDADNDQLINELEDGVRVEAFGGSGRDILQGSKYGDVFEGGTGDDDMHGGNGSDTYKFAGTLLGIDSVFDAANDDSDALDFSGMTAGLTIDIAKFGDNLAVDSANLKLKLSNSTAIETVYATNFNDHIYGNSRNNYLFGKDGNDLLVGRGGVDQMFGEKGNDTFKATDASDQVFGGIGRDTFDGQTEYWYLFNPRPGRYLDWNLI